MFRLILSMHERFDSNRTVQNDTYVRVLPREIVSFLALIFSRKQQDWFGIISNTPGK